MHFTADPRPPGFDWRAVLAFILLPFVLWVGVISTGLAAPVAYRAIALACAGDVPGPDCSADTALDVLAQPAGETECPKVAQLLATHLSLPVGGYHKLRCERREE